MPLRPRPAAIAAAMTFLLRMDQMQNNDRYDLSERLIHFFRTVDRESSDAPVWPEDLGYGSIDEEPILQPNFLLRHAIRMGRLFATWSVRNGRRTIHGLRPAVCFTDMPIPAFIEAGRQRAALGQAMSPYGLVFPKPAAFRLGTRPVIYSLTQEAHAHGGENDTPRVFDEAALPLQEQYRYVAYDPSLGWLDWSHEREWRWRSPADAWTDEDGGPPMHSDDLPGLNLDDDRLKGLGVIVATALEARLVVHDILTKVDRNDIAEDHYAFVLAHETIDDWVDLRERGTLDGAIQSHLIDMTGFFEVDEKQAIALETELDATIAEILSAAPAPEVSDVGGCWLWLLDNQHLVTRALLSLDRVRVNRSGKYLIRMDEFATLGHNLAQREAMTRELAIRLRAARGLRASYFLVLGIADADAVPSFNGDNLDDQYFYNWNWTPADVAERQAYRESSGD